MICSKCGYDNPEGTQICVRCGASLHDAQAPNDVISGAGQSGGVVLSDNLVKQQGQSSENLATESLATMQNTSVSSSSVSSSQFDVAAQKPDDFAATSQMKSSLLKKCVFIALGVIVVVVVAVIAGVLVKNLFFGNIGGDGDTSLEDELAESDAFFLYDRNNRNYLLFSGDGKRLTDVTYDQAESFVNGAARVYKDGEYGIISEKGKMVKDFGDCGFVSQAGALFACTMDEGDWEKIFYTADGKEILRSHDDAGFVDETIGDGYAIVQDSDQYHILSYKGDVIATFAMANLSRNEDPVAVGKGKYVSVSYNGETSVFNIEANKKLTSFSDERLFCIHDVNMESDNELTLGLCKIIGIDWDSYEYKLVKDDEIKYSKTVDDGAGDLYFDGGNVVFEDDEGEYVLDERGEPVFTTYNALFKDDKNYIKKASQRQDGLELYVDGQLKETVECKSLPVDYKYALWGIYELNNCNNSDKNTRYIYHDGTKVNDELYYFAYEFDENGYAVVSDDGDFFHLINTKGETVSDNYYKDRTALKIYNVKGAKDIYYGSNEDGTVTLFKVNGEKLITGDKLVENMESNYGSYVILEKDGRHVVYDTRKRKELASVEDRPQMDKYYFKVSTDDGIQYYSYITGQVFFTE